MMSGLRQCCHLTQRTEARLAVLLLLSLLNVIQTRAGYQLAHQATHSLAINDTFLAKTQNILFFLALFLVVTLAIVIRLSPIVEGNYLIKAFDPWIQYYNAEYLSTHSVFEYFNWHDIKSWFPEGYDRGSLRPGLTFTVVIIYQLINSIGIPISLYDVCFFFPAFMGGASVFAAYLLGKEVLDKKCGLFAAFFLAFNTGFMQRTTAGFFDNETIGVFATLMTFYFFVNFTLPALYTI